MHHHCQISNVLSTESVLQLLKTYDSYRNHYTQNQLTVICIRSPQKMKNYSIRIYIQPMKNNN